MDLYGQEPEVRLLESFLQQLECRVVVDVGAEQGAFAEEMLHSGATELQLLEPEPANAAALRRRFSRRPDVNVHECAVGEQDGVAILHKSVASDGSPISFGHTLLERAPTSEIAWGDSVSVVRRSLGSLVAAGELPSRVGILKIDTEGSDFEVVGGMGLIDADVVMVEHWHDLPLSLGQCPWTLDAMAASLRPRGFAHFAFVVHRGPFVFVKWDDGTLPSGAMGNLIFIHERVRERLLPAILTAASTLAETAVETAEIYAAAAAERESLLLELGAARDVALKAAEERLSLVHRLERECELRAEVIEQLQTQLGVPGAG